MDRLEELLERIADNTKRMAEASERLNALATEEREFDAAQPMFDPPACPHCGELDPLTSIRSGLSGKLSEFVLATPCGNCGNDIYAVPIGWQVTANKDEARQLMEGRETQ